MPAVKPILKSNKLLNVCYDIRGPVLEHAKRLEEEGNADLATDLAQAILISHMDLVKAVLDELGVPHEDGFFAKDTDVSTYLKDGWQQIAWDKFHDKFPPAALLFYINHLAWEVAKAEEVFAPAA